MRVPAVAVAVLSAAVSYGAVASAQAADGVYVYRYKWTASGAPGAPAGGNPGTGNPGGGAGSEPGPQPEDRTDAGPVRFLSVTEPTERVTDYSGSIRLAGSALPVNLVWDGTGHGGTTTYADGGHEATFSEDGCTTKMSVRQGGEPRAWSYTVDVVTDDPSCGSRTVGLVATDENGDTDRWDPATLIEGLPSREDWIEFEVAEQLMFPQGASTLGEDFKITYTEGATDVVFDPAMNGRTHSCPSGGEAFACSHAISNAGKTSTVTIRDRLNNVARAEFSLEKDNDLSDEALWILSVSRSGDFGIAWTEVPPLYATDESGSKGAHSTAPYSFGVLGAGPVVEGGDPNGPTVVTADDGDPDAPSQVVDSRDSQPSSNLIGPFFKGYFVRSKNPELYSKFLADGAVTGRATYRFEPSDDVYKTEMLDEKFFSRSLFGASEGNVNVASAAFASGEADQFGGWDLLRPISPTPDASGYYTFDLSYDIEVTPAYTIDGKTDYCIMDTRARYDLDVTRRLSFDPNRFPEASTVVGRVHRISTPTYTVLNSGFPC